MTGERFVLVYRPADDEAPTSLRLWTRDTALQRADRFNAQNIVNGDTGRWTVHELGPEIEPA